MARGWVEPLLSAPSVQRKGRMRGAKAGLVWIIATVGAIPAAGQDGEEPAVRAVVASGRHEWARWPDFARFEKGVSRLYRSGAWAPIWLQAGQPTPAARAVIDQLLRAPEHGLEPGDYDAALLDSTARRLPELGPEERARFDVLLTVSLTRFLHAVAYGRVARPPLLATGAPARVDPIALVGRARAGDSVAALMRAIEPPLLQYRLLREALARYLLLAADTSLGQLPTDEFVWAGMAYASSARLARTLVALGDLSPDSLPADSLYAGPLVAAVKRFQLRHALPPDGVLGPRTLAGVKTPASARAEEIALALERLRWVPPLGAGRFLVVNIPAFELVGFDSAMAPGPPAVTRRVVVGRPQTRTPLLSGQLRYVEFLPYWYVPASILQGEIVPMLEWSPEYLRSRNMEIVTTRGRVLGDSATPALLRGLRRGALLVRQRPGPLNALGLAKFIFPNGESVYLHDTPSRDLFSAAERVFSHGCISVEDPAGLAEWVLRDPATWPRAAIEAAMAGTRTRRVVLREPLPLLLFYTTAVAHADGKMWFYPDVYGLDSVLTRALAAPPPSASRATPR